MGTLQKLKAYFGMVPADEYDGYDLDDLDEYDDRADYGRGYRRPEYLADEDDYDPYTDQAAGGCVGRRDDALRGRALRRGRPCRLPAPARSRGRVRLVNGGPGAGRAGHGAPPRAGAGRCPCRSRRPSRARGATRWGGS